MYEHEIYYKVYFQGLKYSQPTWEVFKVLDSQFIGMYQVTAKSCNCIGYERHRKCKHLLLRDYYEANNRPVCLLRVSGLIHIFMVELEHNNNS